jgi:hypothetical protein
MQNLNKPILWLMGMLFFFSVTQVEAKGRAGEISLLDKYLSHVGFSGKAVYCADERMFSTLEGNFAIATNTGQADWVSNADTLAACIEQMYRKQGLAFTIRRSYVNEQTGGCSYTQYWKNFYLENQPYYLLICFDKITGKYTITNNLYMQKIRLPGKVISPKTAAEIFNEIFYQYQELYYLKRIKVTTAKPDTLKPEYFSGYESKLRLNLYPVGDANQTYKLMLQFHGDVYNKDSTYYLDAETGKPVDEAAVLFKKHTTMRKRVRKYIDKTGFEGDYTHDNLADPISFNFGSFPFPAFADTAAFQHNADFIVREYLKLWEKADIKLIVDRVSVKRGSEGEEGCIPDQMIYGEYRLIPYFRNLGHCAERKLSIAYNIDENTWSLFLEPGEEINPLPKQAISPQTALKCYQFFTRNIDDTEKNYRFSDIPKKMIKTSTLTRDYVYYDKEAGVTISPVYAPDDWMNSDIGNANFVWNCYDDKDTVNDIYCLDAVTGKEQGFERLDPDYRMPFMNKARQEEMKQRIAACLPGIRIDELKFSPRDSLFTELTGTMQQIPKNSLAFDTLCSTVMDSLSSLYGFGRRELGFYTYVFEGDTYDVYHNSYLQTYRGYSFSSVHNLRMSMEIATGKFSIWFYQCTNQAMAVSEQIITPETAWRIAKGLPQPPAWDKREFYSPDTNFHSALPANIKEEEPDTSEFAELETYKTPAVRLVMFPRYQDWRYDISDDYVLAYQVECNYNQVYYIEAATGNVLQFYSYWD